MVPGGVAGGDRRHGSAHQAYRHGAELAQQMASVPVLILACIDHGDMGPGPGPITRGASIYPAVQNLLLAARALGLGTVLTTLHTQYEREISPAAYPR